MRRYLLAAWTITVVLAGFPGGVEAAPFTPGNLAIYRVGDGSGTLTPAATPVFIDEYTPTGTLVQSIALPTTVSGSNRRLTASGTATSEGYMTRSVNGQYLMLTGYDADVGTPTIASTASATVNRVVGRIDWKGTIDTSTALPDAYDGNNIRGAASTNGTDIWIAGTGSGTSNGVRFTTLGSTSSIRLSSNPTNIRTVSIYNGQLFASMQSGAFRITTVGTGTPTGPADSQTQTNLPGYPTTGTSNFAFVMFDLDSSADFNGTGLDTLYVAIEGGSGGVFKWSWDASANQWVARGSATLTDTRGITGIVNPDNTVTLYVTNGSSLRKITDTAAWNSDINGSFTTLATAANNTVFRGVAFAPVPEPGPLVLGASVLALAAVGYVLRRQRAAKLADAQATTAG